MIFKIPPYSVPQCEHLSIIVNKAALSMMRSATCEVSDSALKCNSRLPSVAGRLLKLAHHVVLDGDYTALSRYYVYEPTTGLHQYLFILVKCGHCALCLHNRQVDLVNRCQMESACYECPPYMITLTYSPAYLPKNRIPIYKRLNLNSLYYKDVQDFFKRLRIRWTRQGLAHNIRYLVAGEYGKTRGRPHYHILLWNNPYHTCGYDSPLQDTRHVLNARRLYEDVFSAWSMCERSAFQCEPAGDGSAAYCTKYLTKCIGSSFRPNGCQRPFVHTSVKDGGIGAPLIKSLASYYRSAPHLQQMSFRLTDGTIKQVPITSYVSNIFYPSASRQVPVQYKELFRSLRDCLGHYYAAGLCSLDYCARVLDYYSLGVLYYALDFQRLSAPDLSAFGIELPQRLDDCLQSIYSELDTYNVNVCTSNYSIHKQNVVGVHDDNNNLAFKMLHAQNIKFKQLSSERL